MVLYGGGKIVNADIGYISGGRQGVYTYYQPATVVNFGTVSAYGTNGTGIFLSAGGQVLNAGTVFGDVGGVRIQGAHATVANYGTIKNRANAPFGVSIDGFFSNYVKNTAYIEDDVVETGARGTMVNSGTIEGSVSIGRGGIITNGISGSTTAHIDGFFTNIAGGTGTINNYGTVSGFFFGVDLSDGGTVNNAQPGAVITTGTGGQDGILISGYPGGTVTNLGTVKVNGTVGFAVNLGTAGGSFTNGSPSVTSAFAGFASPHYGDGFISDPAATITNFATISAANGMFLHGGGSVANNGTAASIYGRFNGVFSGGVATVDNTGTVEALFNFGVELTNGNIVNGSTAATGASIVADRVALVTPGITTTSTAVGIGIITSGSLTNYGTVAGARAGVRIAAGAVANGSAGARSGLVEGVYYGVLAAGTVTQSVAITNFGTIAAIGTAGIGVDLGDTADNTVSNSGTVGGTGGTAVAFGAGDDRLIVGARARFNGVVTGGPGTNEIDFEKTGAVALAPEYVGFARVRLLAADSLALKPADLAGLAGNAIIVFDGNAGDTVSAAALTAGEHATVSGGSGNDVFVGGAGTDIFTGGAGNDAFDFSAAALAASDTVAGGSGSDTLVMTSAGTVVATGVSGVETWRLANGKPNSLQLTNGNFIATTGAAVAVIDGNAGDTVDAEALAASDRVTVTGGSGNDVFIGGAGKDAFAGNGGADTFRFSIADLSSSDSVKGGNGEDTLFLTSAGTVAAGGVSGVETYRLAKAGADALTLTAGNFAGVTAATITVMGGNAGNTVDAHAIAAGDHAVISGGAGKDVLTGGPGADTFEYTIANLSANDVVRGGGGSDTLYLVGPGTLAAGGVSQIETYRLSNAGANTLTLTAGNFAGVTAATITVEGGASGNAVNASQEGAGARTVMIGGAGKDIFTGGAGNDILRFSPATLSAGDIVKGGGGNDTLL
ncbi:MAG TPA: calcium-binding protein, partial [Thermomicrobiales bacterium]|nr:calcium-binding protein [Thermomicrobiales bacterium]